MGAADDGVLRVDFDRRLERRLSSTQGTRMGRAYGKRRLNPYCTRALARLQME